MTPIGFVIIAFVSAIAAGLLGSLLGIGGGILMTPILTMLGVDIHYAFGASIVCVIATSSGSAAAYVKNHMTNLRTAIFLELATTVGAVTGAFMMKGLLHTSHGTSFLYVLFGVVMGFTAFMMLRRKHNPSDLVSEDKWADKLQLHDHYYDYATEREIHYRVTRSPLGLTLMYFAGVLSGLLGIGSGAIAVPVLTAMRLPLKIATATSNLIMGVTAAASATIYFARGQIDPYIAAPVCIGVLAGTGIGTRLVHLVPAKAIRVIFIVVIAITSFQMLKKGLFS